MFRHAVGLVPRHTSVGEAHAEIVAGPHVQSRPHALAGRVQHAGGQRGKRGTPVREGQQRVRHHVDEDVQHVLPEGSGGASFGKRKGKSLKRKAHRRLLSSHGYVYACMHIISNPGSSSRVHTRGACFATVLGRTNSFHGSIERVKQLVERVNRSVPPFILSTPSPLPALTRRTPRWARTRRAAR